MSERKVINKYFPANFDPSLIPRRKMGKDRQQVVRLMAPFSMRCGKCGEYIYKGKKFNARKETVQGEEYYGIKIFRFYIKCTGCSSEITFKTDPKNTDYVAEHGAARNFEPWRDEKEADADNKLDRLEEEENNPMAALENKAVDSKREMDILDALMELKTRNARIERAGRGDESAMLERVSAGVEVGDRELKKKLGEEEERRRREGEEDEELVRKVFGRAFVGGVPDIELGEEESEGEAEGEGDEGPVASGSGSGGTSGGLAASTSTLATAASIKRKLDPVEPTPADLLSAASRSIVDKAGAGAMAPPKKKSKGSSALAAKLGIRLKKLDHTTHSSADQQSGNGPPHPQPHPHSVLSSQEVDLLVYSYLVESGYIHTSFSLAHESSLASGSRNGQKHDPIFDQVVPPGHLVQILAKGLLYLEAEARYRGDPVEPAPRLIGYPIPNALPLPPLPKIQPAPAVTFSPTPGPSTAVDSSASASTPPVPAPTAAPLPPTSTPAAPPPAPAASTSTATPSVPISAKEKGKGKEVTTTGKRKGRTGSDRDEGSDGKRARTSSGEKKKAASTSNGAMASSMLNGDSKMDSSSSSSTTNHITTIKVGKVTEISGSILASIGGGGEKGKESSTTKRKSKSASPVPPVTTITKTVIQSTPLTTSSLPPKTISASNSTATPPTIVSPPSKSFTIPPPANAFPKPPPGTTINSAAAISPSIPSPALPSTTPATATASPSFPIPPPRPSAFPTSTSSNSSTSTKISFPTPSHSAFPTPSTSHTKSPPSFPPAPSSVLSSPPTTSPPTVPTPTLTTAGSTSTPAPVMVKSRSHQSELAKIKAEEAEASLRLPGPEDVKMDMTQVVQLGIEDAGVIRLQGHEKPKVQPCSWNSKVPGLLATGGGDSTCRIWDVPMVTPDEGGAEGKKLGAQILTENTVLKHSSAQRKVDVNAVAWDPSGSLLATGSEDGIARIWTPSGDLHLVLSMHQRTIFSLKWNSLGTMLLTGSLDNTVCLWELSSGKVKQQWSTHSDSVLDVDWNDDQTFASASMDKAIHLFSVSRVSPIHRFKGHRDEVNIVKFSSCGSLLASCSDDHTVRIWSLRNIPGLTLGSKIDSREEGRFIDEEDNGGVLVLEGHTRDVHTVAWGPWKKGGDEPRLLASASFDGTSRLWNVENGTCLRTFRRHTDFVYSLGFSPGLGTYLATGSNDGKMCIWDVKEGKLVLEYVHAGPIYEVLWHPKGDQLVVCGQSCDVAVSQTANKTERTSSHSTLSSAPPSTANSREGTTNSDAPLSTASDLSVGQSFQSNNPSKTEELIRYTNHNLIAPTPLFQQSNRPASFASSTSSFASVGRGGRVRLGGSSSSGSSVKAGKSTIELNSLAQEELMKEESLNGAAAAEDPYAWERPIERMNRLSKQWDVSPSYQYSENRRISRLPAGLAQIDPFGYGMSDASPYDGALLFSPQSNSHQNGQRRASSYHTNMAGSSYPSSSTFSSMSAASSTLRVSTSAGPSRSVPDIAEGGIKGFGEAGELGAPWQKKERSVSASEKGRFGGGGGEMSQPMMMSPVKRGNGGVSPRNGPVGGGSGPSKLSGEIEVGVSSSISGESTIPPVQGIVIPSEADYFKSDLYKRTLKAKKALEKKDHSKSPGSSHDLAAMEQEGTPSVTSKSEKKRSKSYSWFRSRSEVALSTQLEAAEPTPLPASNGIPNPQYPLPTEEDFSIPRRPLVPDTSVSNGVTSDTLKRASVPPPSRPEAITLRDPVATLLVSPIRRDSSLPNSAPSNLTTFNSTHSVKSSAPPLINNTNGPTSLPPSVGTILPGFRPLGPGSPPPPRDPIPARPVSEIVLPSQTTLPTPNQSGSTLPPGAGLPHPAFYNQRQGGSKLSLHNLFGRSSKASSEGSVQGSNAKETKPVGAKKSQGEAQKKVAAEKKKPKVGSTATGGKTGFFNRSKSIPSPSNSPPKSNSKPSVKPPLVPEFASTKYTAPPKKNGVHPIPPPTAASRVPHSSAPSLPPPSLPAPRPAMSASTSSPAVLPSKATKPLPLSSPSASSASHPSTHSKFFSFGRMRAQSQPLTASTTSAFAAKELPGIPPPSPIESDNEGHVSNSQRRTKETLPPKLTNEWNGNGRLLANGSSAHLVVTEG